MLLLVVIVYGSDFMFDNIKKALYFKRTNLLLQSGIIEKNY